MRFNEVEVRLLRKEFATHRLKPVADLRELGCPVAVFERIMEQRANKLGPDFEIVRKQAASSDELCQKIQASRLF